jgi:hypothetical protein
MRLLQAQSLRKSQEGVKIPTKENEAQALAEIMAETGNYVVYCGNDGDEDDYDQQGGNTDV